MDGWIPRWPPSGDRLSTYTGTLAPIGLFHALGQAAALCAYLPTEGLLVEMASAGPAVSLILTRMRRLGVCVAGEMLC